MSEESVTRTNDDASQCKRSAVSLGYWQDPYLNELVPRQGLTFQGEMRKAPEIHLGYYTRVCTIWNLLIKAVDKISEIQGKGAKVQILNLGAGYDTLFWRVQDYLESSFRNDMIKCFVDIDLPEVTAKKCMSVRRSNNLLAKVAGVGNEEVKFSRTDMHGHCYHIVAVNFTDIDLLEKKLSECTGFSYDLPTIFICECVMVYIEPTKANNFLKWTSTKFHSSIAMINHEQINIFDKFGQVMLENLSQRGCSLPGIEACRNKNTHIQRLVTSGWDSGVCWTMYELYNLLPKEDINRVEKIEFLDERELVNQLFEHYCVSFCWKNVSDLCFDEIEFF